jgi:hypothetical protein
VDPEIKGRVSTKWQGSVGSVFDAVMTTTASTSRSKRSSNCAEGYPARRSQTARVRKSQLVGRRLRRDQALELCQSRLALSLGRLKTQRRSRWKSEPTDDCDRSSSSIAKLIELIEALMCLNHKWRLKPSATRDFARDIGVQSVSWTATFSGSRLADPILSEQSAEPVKRYPASTFAAASPAGRLEDSVTESAA